MDKKYKIIKDKEDERDHLFADHHKILNNLPNEVDLRSKCSPIVDQGELGSCTANSICSGLREYVLINDEKQPLVRLSRLYLYYWERYIEHTVNEDAGASIRDGMKVIYKYGTCLESDDPYIIAKFADAPTPEEIEEAKKYKISGYQRLTCLNDIKNALYQNHPVVFGMDLFSSFESDDVAKTGIVPIPQNTEEELGGHCMLIVGYQDDKQQFIVRNSWGETWGDKGYCYIPYVMMQYFTDAWTVRYNKNFLSDYIKPIYEFVNKIKYYKLCNK